MQINARNPWRIALLAGGLFVLVQVQAARSLAEETAPVRNENSSADEELNSSVDLLAAVRNGDVSVDAEGSGDGRMTLSVTNKTKRKLRVVLPPGLIASGAT